jgi:peptide/nickel transport system substrate-binding protein
MLSRRNVITLVVAVGSCARARRTPDDTIVVVMDQPASTADPRHEVSNYDNKLVHLVTAGLTTTDTPTGEPALDLAARIDRKDALTIDATLRDDARFSDGTPVTADDVARSYASVLDPACGSSSHTGFAQRYASVEAIGPRAVRFHMKQPVALFDADISFGIVSFAGVPPGSCDLPRVVGAGPYVLRELTGDAAYLDANPHARVVPRLPHVELRFVRDAGARIVMLVGGSADLVQNGVRADLVDDVAERERVRVVAGPSILLTFLMMNNADPRLADARVRRAIAYAIDRPALVAAKYGGRARLATGLVAPGQRYYFGGVARYDRDLPRARALLDAAGLRPDRDGVRLRLVYKTSSDAFRLALARALAAQLADVGIAVEVRAFEFATFFADVKAGNFQLAVMTTAEVVDPDSYFSYFHSSRIPRAGDPDVGNRSRYRNARVDELVEAGRRELDPARRAGIYAEVQRIVADDVPVVPLWHEDNVAIANVDLVGYATVADARLVGLVAATKTARR